MKKDNPDPSRQEKLRREAETRLEARFPLPEELSPEAAGRLLHELKVHQIELEMQNEELRRAQAELEESRNRYWDLYDFAPVGYLTLDDRGRILEANLTAAKLLEVERGRLVGSWFRLLVHKPSKAALDHHLQAVLADPGSHSIDLRCTTKSRDDLFLRLESIAVAGGDGPLVRTVLTDVTERRQAELLDLAQDAITVRDLSGRITFWNRGAARMYGWTPQEALGQVIHRLLQTEFPEPLEEIEARLLADGYWEGELTHHTRDGRQLIQASRWALKRDEQGRPQAILQICTDITARKEAEREVYHQVSFPRLNPNPVLEVDEEGSILFANPAARRVAERLGLAAGVRAFLPPDLKERFAAARESGEHSFSFELTLEDAVYLVSVFFPHDLAAARLYATDITQRHRMEEALRESEERYRSLFQNNHSVMLLIDPETGTIEDANPAAEIFYGWSREELAAKKITELNTLPPEQVFAEMARARAEKRRHFYFQHRLASGELREVEIFSGPIQMGGRSLLYSIIHDVTARRRAEEALRQSEERLLLAQQVAKIGTFEWNLQTGVNTWTPELEAMYGLPPGGFVGTQTAWEDFIHPDDRPEAVRQVEEAFRTGELTDGEWRVVWPDGSIRWLFGRWQVFKDDSGRPQRMTGINLDITDRKLTEQALRESREDLNRAQAVAHTGSWRLNVQKNELTWSDESHRIFGIPLGTPLTYESFLGTVHPDDREFVDRKWQAALRGEPYDIEHRVVADGRVKWVREQAGLEFDAEGRLLGGFGTTQDITQRKQVEEALRRAHDELELRVEERTRDLRHTVEQLLWEIEERQKVEAKLRESEARFAAFMQHLPGPAVMRDVQGRYIYANEAWERVVGKNRQQWQGKPLTEIWPAERAAHLAAIDYRVLATGQAEAAVEELDQPHDRRYFLTSRFPIPDAGGLPYMVGDIAIDITARKQAEAALEQERRRLFEVLETIPAYVALLAPDYTVPYVNQEFARRFGQGEAGERCFEFLFGLTEPCPDRRTFQVLETGRSQEWEWLGPDGRTYAVYDHPFADTDGSPLILEMGVDITDRKQAEKALAEHAALIQDLYNHAPCGYHSLDADGLIVQMNDTELAWLGYAREEVVGRLKFPDLLTPESLTTFRENFPGFKARGWVQDLEYELRRKDGTILPVLLNATAIRDEAGNYLMSRSTIFDLTERRRAEEAVRQSEALLRQVLETLPVGVWVSDATGRITLSNPAARRIWGGSRYVSIERYGEYKGWWADTGERLEAEDWALARAVQKGETSMGEVIDIQGFDGSRKTILNSAVPIRGNNGEILGAIVVNEDITEMRRAERLVTEQARQLAAYFAHDLTPLVFLDPQFNFLKVNAAYARACNRQVEDFPGRNHFELYPHPENQAIFRRVVETKKPYLAVAKPFEFPDHPEWGVTYWDWTLAPVLDEAGEVDFLVFSLSDVTQRVEAEEVRSRLIAILEATPDFVGTSDAQGRVTYLNRTARLLLGLGEAEDVSSVRIRESHPPWAADLVTQEGFPRAAQEGFWQGETAMLNRDGREVPMSQVILAHKDPHGQVSFYSTIARDISQLLQVQTALRQSEEKLRHLSAQLLAAQESERKRIAAELHDELGHGLLTIKLQLRTLERALLPEQRVLAEEIEELLHFIDAVMNNVRRLYFDLSPGNLEDLGLTGALRQMIDQFARYHPGIRWQVRLADLDPDFPLPAQTAIYRIMQELLNNIGKHAHPAHVQVSSRRGLEAASFMVEDDGRGFDPHAAFAARKGVGLAAMEERLRLLGGSLEIFSREHQGTRITFTIPFP